MLRSAVAPETSQPALSPRRSSPWRVWRRTTGLRILEPHGRLGSLGRMHRNAVIPTRVVFCELGLRGPRVGPIPCPVRRPWSPPHTLAAGQKYDLERSQTRPRTSISGTNFHPHPPSTSSPLPPRISCCFYFWQTFWQTSWASVVGLSVGATVGGTHRLFGAHGSPSRLDILRCTAPSNN